MAGASGLPYKIAVLCDLRDAQGRVLLLHRRKEPNRDMYSPIGGKLDTATGESPTACAQREIFEEAGIEVAIEDLALVGMVSERAYEGDVHWMMFIYRVARPVEVTRREFEEGLLEWHPPEALERLALPETDREVIWPLLAACEGAFFAVHIDCTETPFAWRVEQGPARVRGSGTGRFSVPSREEGAGGACPGVCG